MREILVIGPVKGVYHLAYHDDGSGVFYSIQEFTKKEMAQAIADKMNRCRISDFITRDAMGPA